MAKRYPAVRHVGVDINATAMTLTSLGAAGPNRATPLRRVDEILQTSMTPHDVGKGTFGTVFGGTVSDEGRAMLHWPANVTEPQYDFVRKYMPIDDSGVTPSMLHELAARNLSDVNIMPLSGAHAEATDPPMVGGSMQLTMDPMEMDLAKLCATAQTDANEDNDSQTQVAHNECKVLAYQIVRAVAYLHNNLIIHGTLNSTISWWRGPVMSQLM
jgi:serine/threonine protein kinase